MIQEKVRLGHTLILPRKWRETIRAADGDELTVLYHEDGILIVKDPDQVKKSLRFMRMRFLQNFFDRRGPWFRRLF